MSTIPARPARSRGLVLRGIDWKTYSRLVWAFAEHRGVRLTYDRGRLEIMSPLLVHDGDADFLGQLIVVLTEELGLPRLAGGSTTLRRRKHRKGLEPDRCYWIANEAAIRGKKRLDLRVDPPPDLAIEVDVTSSSLDRMAIYAALGVPEVWRLDGSSLTFQVLAAGSYTVVTHSRSFPLVTPADLMGFVALRATQGEAAAGHQFRAWVRQQLAARPQTP
jgi:Uma2 family endonuclease